VPIVQTKLLVSRDCICEYARSVGLAPFLGGAILTVLFVFAVVYYSNPINSSTGNLAWLPFIHFNFTFLHQHFSVKKGLGPPLVLGVGLCSSGCPSW